MTGQVLLLLQLAFPARARCPPRVSPVLPPTSPVLVFTRIADRGICGWRSAPGGCGKETAVTVSLRRMSAGSAYQYLLRSVAAGDGSRALSTPLTRYYSEAGTPSGRWLGSGTRAFGNGKLAAGMQVTEEQLALLIGMG